MTEFDIITIEGCRFEGNDPRPGFVGGIQGSVVGGSSLSVRDCVFFRNFSDGIGGAVALNGVMPIYFEGNTVVENEGGSNGAAVWLGGPVTVRNNIIALTSGSGAALKMGSTVNAGCNLFWNNPNGDFVNYTPDSTDMFADPRFCDEEQGDLRLRPDSPCLPENSNGCDLIGAIGETCGSVSVEPISWGRLKDQYREGGR